MARARAAAGVLFFDEVGRVLLVEPSYKPKWDIPGGYVEPDEAPYSACGREVAEELGISPPIGRLLVVDWSPNPVDGDKLCFVFHGGLLAPSWRGRIRVDQVEIVSCAFTAVADFDLRLPAEHARRMRSAVAAARAGEGEGVGYLEHGRPVPASAAAASDPR
jgi:8-oxo-dGTP pyrophosphatase MutT (NUDIX family)